MNGIKKLLFETLDNCFENSPETLQEPNIYIVSELLRMNLGFESIRLDDLVCLIADYKLDKFKGISYKFDHDLGLIKFYHDNVLITTWICRVEPEESFADFMAIYNFSFEHGKLEGSE